MNRHDPESIDRALSEELAQSDHGVYVRPPSSNEPHPELQEIAAYVDGGVSGTARERLEGHLADCAACRRIAMEASLSIDDQEARAVAGSKTWWRRWRPAFGLAAATVAVAIGLFWLRPGTPTDAERRRAAQFLGQHQASRWTPFCRMLICLNEFAYVD